MSYHWNWGILLSPVSTGEPTTYLGWLLSGLWVTVTVSLCAWVIALIVGSFFGVLRTVQNPRVAAIGTVYVAIFRNIPLIVQFFVWYLVIPELLPVSIGTWFKQLPPGAQFFSSSIICLGLFTAARVCEQVRTGPDAMADVSLRALARGLPDHRAAAHVRVPEHLQELCRCVDDRSARSVRAGAPARRLHGADV
jgi:glutamate/aspartate transport system permease protein